MKKIITVTVALILMLTLVSCAKSEEEVAAEEAFNAEVARIQAELEKRDADVEAAQAVVDDERPALDETLKPALQTAISEASAIEFDAPKASGGVEETNSATEELKKITYTDQLQSLKDATKALSDSIKKYELVNAPEESYVIKCLKTVKDIDGIAAATEDHDPNGNLHKDGGYTAQVYFSCPLVDHSYMDNDIIEAGTDGGGSVEVYKTAEEAKKREEYLAGFDGTITASGSHEVIGTCIVRTSDSLTATQQKELEAAIIEALTKIE